jgi:C-terminal processing protease CtpA/Prc
MKTFSLICLLSWCSIAAFAQGEGKQLTVAQQQADFKILKQALKHMHPGLERFNTKQEMEGHFAQLKQQLQTPQTERSMFRLLAQFAAKIKCSHTYCNPWNMDKGVKTRLYGANPKKFPFKFKMLGERMIITKDLSEENQLKRGDEVTHINGVAMKEIVAKLRTVAKKDGNAYPQQLANIEGYGFDYYFPLFFEVKPSYQLKVKQFASGKTIDVAAKGVTIGTQIKLHEARFGKVKSYDDRWSLKIEKGVAYLEVGTFVTWRMKNIKWKKFLRKAFAQIKQQNIKTLVLDLRSNGGGLTDAAVDLLRYLYKKPFKFNEKVLVKNYQAGKVGEYLDTWDKKMLNPPAKLFAKQANGWYEYLPGAKKQWKPHKNAFKGKLYVLCSAQNGSGATVTLAHIQEQKLGTIIGQETGGSKEGPIGGQIFYLRLPNTHMELDLPVMRSFVPMKYPQKLKKDRGVIPDITVKKSVADIAKGIDTELDFVKKKFILAPKTEK